MERYATLTKLTSLLGFYQSTKANREKTTNGSTSANKGPRVSATDPKVKSAQSVITEKITAGPDGKTLMPTSQSELATEMMKCFHRDDSDALGGAICKIPAMELESPDEGDSRMHSVGADIMPSLGQSHEDIAMRNAQDHAPRPVDPPAPSGTDKPPMAASVLQMMATTNSSADANGNTTPNGDGNGSTAASTTPSSHLKVTAASLASISAASLSCQASKKNLAEETSSSSANSTKLEMAATVNMGRPLSFTRTSSPHAPGALIRSLFSSFSTLVNSRVRTWTLLLLRHSLSSGDENSRSNLMSLLASQHSYELRAMMTEFTVENATSEMKEKLIQEGQIRREARKKAQLEQKSALGMEFCDMILPFQFKAIIDITVQDHQVTVNLYAPGSIGAIFHEDGSAITYMECKIDTNTLIKSMIEQARLVVFQSVARATSSSRKVMDKMMSPPKEHPRLLSSLGSKLSLASTASDKSAQSSSLFSSSSRSSSSSTAVVPLLRRPGSRIQTNRSVQWDHAIKDTSLRRNTTKESSNQCSGKKRTFPSLGGGGSLKRSTKSFGKPGSDIFRSSRNATFAEFGNAGQNPHVKNTNGGGGQKNAHSLSRYHVSTHILQRNGNESEIQSNSVGQTNASFANPSFATPGGNWNKRKPSFQELSRSAVYSVTPPAASASFLSLQGMTNSVNGSLTRTPTQLETLLLSTQTKRKSKSNRNDVRY